MFFIFTNPKRRETTKFMNDEFINKSGKLLTIVLTLSLIPMLVIAIYARPFVDDYGYSTRTHDAWQSTHSVIALLGAMGKEVVEAYHTWQGSFSAIAIFSLQPGIISERVYGLSTLILVALFLLGNYLFITALFKEKSSLTTVVFSSISILLMQTLPHAIQGFYWWNGSSYYTLFYSLMLIQWGMLIRQKRFILPCILGFFIGGGNLVTGLLNLEIMALAIIYSTFKIWIAPKKHNAEDTPAATSIKRFIKLIIITAISAAGFIINVLAPGNQVRASESVSRPALEAIGVSFLDAFAYLNEWLNLPVIMFLLLLLPFLWHYAKDKKSLTPEIPVFILFIIAFCLFASTFTPTEYSMSEVGPRRIQNVRYYTFVVFLMFLELESVIRTRALFESKGIATNPDLTKAYLTRYLLIVIAGLTIFLGVNTIPKENRDNITSISATRTLLIGEAKRYADARNEWTRILLSDDKEVTLNVINEQPKPIYYSEFDITGNPDDYRDESMCKYYHKTRINLVE